MHDFIITGELFKVAIELILEGFLMVTLMTRRHPFAKTYGWICPVQEIASDLYKVQFATKEWTVFLRLQLWDRVVRHVTLYRMRLCLIVVLGVWIFVQLILAGLWVARQFERHKHANVDSRMTVMVTTADASLSPPPVPATSDEVSMFLERIFIKTLNGYVFVFPLVCFTLASYALRITEPDAEAVVEMLKNGSTKVSIPSEKGESSH